MTITTTIKILAYICYIQPAIWANNRDGHHAMLNVLPDTAPITVIILIVTITCAACFIQRTAGHQNALVTLMHQMHHIIGNVTTATMTTMTTMAPFPHVHYYHAQIRLQSKTHQLYIPLVLPHKTVGAASYRAPSSIHDGALTILAQPSCNR
jgi:hypothetical protein